MQLQMLQRFVKPVRWSVVGIVLLSSVFFTLRWNWVICEDKLATVGSQAVVKVCHSPSVTDLPVVTTILLIILLLLPDLSEIGIPGFISLKRQVGQQEAKLEMLRTEVQQAVSQDVAQKVDTTLNINLADTKEALHEFERKSGIPSRGVMDNGVSSIDGAQRRELKIQLLEHAATLDDLVKRGSALTEVDKAKAKEQDLLFELLGRKVQRRPDENYFQLTRAISESRERLRFLDSQPDSEKDAELVEWIEAFAPEISIIRAARDAIAHAQPIADDKLVEAAQLAEGLLASWKARETTRSSALQKS
jgi:hypothetical protein